MICNSVENKNGLLTQYLNETKHNVKRQFTALKWLQYIDQDSLNMLVKYSDNFDEMYSSNINDDEVIDMFQLVNTIMKLESKKPKLDSVESMRNFCIFITMENMRRKGLINIEGNGNITDFETKFSLTKKGIEIQEHIKK